MLTFTVRHIVVGCIAGVIAACFGLTKHALTFGQDAAAAVPTAISDPPDDLPLNSLDLLLRSAVAEDLQLTKDQSARIKEFARELQKMRSSRKISERSSIQTGANLSPEFAREMTDQQSLQLELGTILTPAQRQRLKQIDLQHRGAAALFDKQIAERLALSPRQIERLETLQDEALETLNSHYDLGDFDDERRSEAKLRAVQRAFSMKAVRLLNPKQRKLYDELLGPEVGAPNSAVPPQSP